MHDTTVSDMFKINVVYIFIDTLHEYINRGLSLIKHIILPHIQLVL